ncbi:MAG: 5'/3'-nucleotidase SurE [Chlamydiales bacterium]
MSRRPHFLLTNDDGIHAPGINSLWKVLHDADIADLTIIAPSVERSGTGVSITWDRPMHIQEMEWSHNTPAWAIDGTPADCVKLGIRVILERKVDMVISGINAGSNAGRNLLHSGTVGAAIEGIFRGIPSIAFSCEDGDNPNFHVAEKYIVPIVQYMLENPFDDQTLLNVNFPHAAQDKVEGFKLTKQGKGRWAENPYLHNKTEFGSSYWLGGKPDELIEDPDCDIALLRKGYMTAVPIRAAELTNYDALRERRENFENFFLKKIPDYAI